MKRKERHCRDGKNPKWKIMERTDSHSSVIGKGQPDGQSSVNLRQPDGQPRWLFSGRLWLIWGNPMDNSLLGGSVARWLGGCSVANLEQPDGQPEQTCFVATQWSAVVDHGSNLSRNSVASKYCIVFNRGSHAATKSLIGSSHSQVDLSSCVDPWAICGHLGR